MYIVFDEAHCISRWGTFRNEYRDVGRLRYYLPNTPFYATSAMLPQKVLDDVRHVLHMHAGNTNMLVRSNDRPNVYLAVKRLVYSVKSFKDLKFLIPINCKAGMGKPPKFLVFFNNMKKRLQISPRSPTKRTSSKNQMVSFSYVERFSGKGGRPYAYGRDMGLVCHRFLWYGACVYLCAIIVTSSPRRECIYLI